MHLKWCLFFLLRSGLPRETYATGRRVCTVKNTLIIFSVAPKSVSINIRHTTARGSAGQCRTKPNCEQVSHPSLAHNQTYSLIGWRAAARRLACPFEAGSGEGPQTTAVALRGGCTAGWKACKWESCA